MMTINVKNNAPQTIQVAINQWDMTDHGQVIHSIG